MKIKSMRIQEDIDKAIGYVAREYKAGKTTLREAAYLLNLTLSETIDLLSDLGVKGNIHAADVMKSLESLTKTN